MMEEQVIENGFDSRESMNSTRRAKWIFIGLFIVVVGLSLMFWPNNSISDTISPISFIYVEDENSTIVITKNNFAKTAEISMEVFVDPEEVQSTPTFNVVEFATELYCGVMQVTFFHEETFTEFNKRMNEWNEKKITLENEEDTSEKHLKTRLDGYTITLFKYSMINKETEEKLSECSVTGLLDEEKEIIIY